VELSLWVLLPVGLATGYLAGTIGVGGFIGVPAMIYVFGVPTAVAAGTELYLLMDQLLKAAGFSPGALNLVVRSTLPFDALAPACRQSVARLDPSLPVVKMRSMDDVMGEAIARPRFLTMLLAAVAGVMSIVAAMACIVPARRATRVGPLVALKEA